MSVKIYFSPTFFMKKYMNDIRPNLFIYLIGIFAGFLVGVFIMYMGHVRPNLLLPEKDYVCVDAEPIDIDPSIVACTIVLRKDSTAHKKYLELDRDTGI